MLLRAARSALAAQEQLQAIFAYRYIALGFQPKPRDLDVIAEHYVEEDRPDGVGTARSGSSRYMRREIRMRTKSCDMLPGVRL